MDKRACSEGAVIPEAGYSWNYAIGRLTRQGGPKVQIHIRCSASPGDLRAGSYCRGAFNQWLVFLYDFDTVARRHLACQHYHPADSGCRLALKFVGRRDLPRTDTQHHRKFYPRGIASHLARHALYLGNVSRRLFRAESSRHPSVGPSRDPLKRRARIVRAEKNGRMRLLKWLGKEPHRRKPDDFAHVSRSRACPTIRASLQPTRADGASAA